MPHEIILWSAGKWFIQEGRARIQLQAEVFFSFLIWQGKEQRFIDTNYPIKTQYRKVCLKRKYQNLPALAFLKPEAILRRCYWLISQTDSVLWRIFVLFLEWVRMGEGWSLWEVRFTVNWNYQPRTPIGKYLALDI